MKNRNTHIAGTRTGIQDEGGPLQVEGERDSVGTESDAFSYTVMVVDLVTIVLQLVGGGEELTEVNAGVGTAVVDAGIDQGLEQISNDCQQNDRGSEVPDGPLQELSEVMDRATELPSG